MYKKEYIFIHDWIIKLWTGGLVQMRNKCDFTEWASLLTVYKYVTEIMVEHQILWTLLCCLPV